MKACIIGAGSSGIAAAKALHERSIAFDCFEKSDRVGGNWVFGNKNGMSSAYEGLYINTSRDRMQYSDFPMPRSYPDFPHHSQIARYFDQYVDHFGFRSRILFETGVERAWLEGKRWRVKLSSGEERTFDALLVAASRADRVAKGALPGDPWLELEALVARIAGVRLAA